MAGDPRTRDPNEPWPIIPDKRYDEKKPIGYDPHEGPRYLGASGCADCDCGGDCGGCTDCACGEVPALDMDPYDSTPGYYSESGDVHEDLPVALASVRNRDLHAALRGLCVERVLAERAWGSAIKRQASKAPVLASFNTLRAWGTLMSDGEWGGVLKAASGGIPFGQHRIPSLFKRRVAEILALHHLPLKCAAAPEACRMRQAIRQGSVEGVLQGVQWVGPDSPTELRRVAWIVDEFGPGSPHFEGSQDLMRKLQVWAMPELRLLDGR